MAKRNAQGGGTIRQRPDGRWEARITVGRNPATGKQLQRSVYGKTQQEARKKLAQLVAALDAGEYQAPSRITVARWMDEWMETYCSARLKPLSYSRYEGIIANHIKPALGSLELQALKGPDVQRLYNALSKRGLSGTTIQTVSAVLRRACLVAMQQGIIRANPCDLASRPKTKRADIHPLTDAEIPRFLEAIDRSPMRNAYALSLFAGLRECECLGLSWPQVDLERGKITISQQLQYRPHVGYVIATTKRDKTRIITLPAIAVDYLRAEKIQQLENRIKAGQSWSNPHDLVFTDSAGEHWSVSTYYTRYKRIAAAIGRPDGHPHDLRHTAATVALASGADIKTVQDMLGHSSARITLDVYAHTSDRMKEDTAQRVQGYYDTLSPAVGSCKGSN